MSNHLRGFSTSVEAHSISEDDSSVNVMCSISQYGLEFKFYVYKGVLGAFIMAETPHIMCFGYVGELEGKAGFIASVIDDYASQLSRGSRTSLPELVTKISAMLHQTAQFALLSAQKRVTIRDCIRRLALAVADQEDEICVLCQEKVSKGDELRELPCNKKHRFHKNCIDGEFNSDRGLSNEREFSNTYFRLKYGFS